MFIILSYNVYGQCDTTHRARLINCYPRYWNYHEHYNYADSATSATFTAAMYDSLADKEAYFGLPDTTGKTGMALKVKTGGGFEWVASAGLDSTTVRGMIADSLAIVRYQDSISTPHGLISMYYGAVANIPTGWVLCDGTQGTPDLRDRFVIGAGGSFPVDSTGGSTTFTVSGTAAAQTFTGSSSTTYTPAGTLSITMNSLTPHQHDESHVHSQGTMINSGAGLGIGVNDAAYVGNTGNETATITPTVSIATFNGNNAVIIPIGSNSSSSVTGTASGQPTFYALCYIMRKRW